MSVHWSYEDGFHRFYHGSFKVYGIQTTTGRAVKLLREVLPERKLNLAFEDITRDGTGKEFQMEHNRDWDRHTRPLLEAFCHAKFMIEMAANGGKRIKLRQAVILAENAAVSEMWFFSRPS